MGSWSSKSILTIQPGNRSDLDNGRESLYLKSIVIRLYFSVFFIELSAWELLPWTQTAWIQILILPLNSCVTLDMLLVVSKSQFLLPATQV